MSTRRRHRKIAVAAAAVAVVAASAGGLYGVRRLTAAKSAERLPATPARGGEFLVIVRCRGELRARRSVQVSAPANVPELRIVWIAEPGSQIKAGDPVVRFDPSRPREQLNEKEAALRQAQASVEQAAAEALITAEQDRRDLSAARYEVERARLEASKKTIVSVLQGEESRVDLALAERKRRVQEATVTLHAASDKAKIASFARARDLAQAELDVVKDRLARLEVKAPLSGVINFLPNYSQGWLEAKPFKVGDQAWPGVPMAEIPDLTTLEMEGKVEEIDRGRVAAGNEVRVRVDALPELTIRSQLAEISALTEVTWEWPPTSNFRAYAPIEKPDPRLRPAMAGSMDVVVRRIPSAIAIPAKALFTRNAKPVVFIRAERGYRPVEVQVLARNPDEVAVSGIAAGAEVALLEPAPEEKPE